MKKRILTSVAVAVGFLWSAHVGESFCRAAEAAVDTPAAIRGTIVDDQGKAIEGVTIAISTAAKRLGANPYCPSCYADCAKRAKSNADGTFSIAALDPTLVFHVLFVAKGFEPKFVKIDPLKETSVTVSLKPRAKLPDDPHRIVSGQVVGPRGEPLVGALVEPFGSKQGERRWWGSLPGVDPLAVTDSQGRFQIVADKPAEGFDLEVTARGLAKKRFELVPVAKRDNRLQLAAGATVRGRVVDHGKPVPGVEVGLVQTNRGSDTFLGAATIGTDAHGRFLFANVSANDEYFVYGIMQSLGRRGGISEKRIHVGADESETDVGDLAIEPAFRLSGRIALSDSKPIPLHTRVLISRDQAWDLQIVDAGTDGSFKATGIPRGVVTISAQIPNYHLSTKNKSLERLNWIFLKGLVDKDVDGLIVLFEPGKLVRPPYPRDPRAQKALARSYERLKVEPPVGVTPDLKAPEGTEPEIVEQFATELAAKPRKPLPKIDLPPPLPEPVAADADVPKRTVSGHVIDEAGKPIPDAEVWLPVRWAPPNRTLTVHAKCDTDGHFKLAFPVSWLPEKATIVEINGTVWAFAPGHSIGLADGRFQVLGEPAAKPCEVRLGPPSDLSLTFSLPDGSPVAGASILPHYYSHREIGLTEFVPDELVAKLSAKTDADGRAALPALALDRVQDVKVVGDAIGSQVVQLVHFQFQDDKQHLRREMTLLPVGRLEGRVVSEQPELLRNMSITIKTDPQSGEQCTGTATVTPDADGRFVIPRIAAGWVEVEAALADPRFRVRPRFIGRRQLEVAPGKTTRLDIPLETARKVAGVVRVKGTHEPVVGARLAIRFGDVAQWDQVATDSQGRYSAVVLPGQVSMQVIYAGRPDLTQLSDSRMARFPVPDGTSEFELPAVDLVKTKSVSGRLLDHEGKPLRKYRITGLVGNNRVGWGESNESGNFTLGSVPEDVQLERYQIHTEASPIPKDTTVVTRDPLVIRLK